MTPAPHERTRTRPRVGGAPPVNSPLAPGRACLTPEVSMARQVTGLRGVFRSVGVRRIGRLRGGPMVAARRGRPRTRPRVGAPPLNRPASGRARLSPRAATGRQVVGAPDVLPGPVPLGRAVRAEGVR